MSRIVFKVLWHTFNYNSLGRSGLFVGLTSNSSKMANGPEDGLESEAALKECYSLTFGEQLRK